MRMPAVTCEHPGIKLVPTLPICTQMVPSCWPSQATAEGVSHLAVCCAARRAVVVHALTRHMRTHTQTAAQLPVILLPAHHVRLLRPALALHTQTQHAAQQQGVDGPSSYTRAESSSRTRRLRYIRFHSQAG